MTRRISLVAVAGLAVLAMTASAAFAVAGPVPTADIVNRAAAASDKNYGPDKQVAATLPTQAPFDLNKRFSTVTSVARDPDDPRFRLDAASGSVTGGNDIEWPQIGIGFAIGLVLAFGLYLAMRLMRVRELAH